MKKLLHDCFTGKDNKTYDFGRIIIFLACLVFFYCSVAETLKGHDFQPIEFGTGFGLLFGAGAAGLHFKRKTEPDEEIYDKSDKDSDNSTNKRGRKPRVPKN